MKNLYEKFKTSLTDFLLILILIFLGVGINLLSGINNKLDDIDSLTSNVANSTFAIALEIKRDNSDKPWTKEEYEKTWNYYKNLAKIWNNKK